MEKLKYERVEMAISRKDARKMQRLAQEGKQISKIVQEDFPTLDYWDVYIEIYGSGERSSRGIKKMITIRLNSLVNATKNDRRGIVKELQELVWHLYGKHKKNHEKLDKIRKVLGT